MKSIYQVMDQCQRNLLEFQIYACAARQQFPTVQQEAVSPLEVLGLVSPRNLSVLISFHI
jgi:hypothetical protein